MKNEIKISTIIGEGAVCSGDFSAEKSVRIDGTIRGNVKVTGMLIIGAAGQIDGNIDAEAVIVGGRVCGNINSPKKVELTSSAVVNGDITTDLIVIDENAVFCGKCNMESAVDRNRHPSGWELRAERKSADIAIAEAIKEAEEGKIQEETKE